MIESTKNSLDIQILDKELQDWYVDQTSFVDRFNRRFAPARNDLVFVIPWTAGGRTRSGIIVRHARELPKMYGVVVSILPDCEHSLQFLRRDEGAIVKLDLIIYPRYATWPLSSLYVHYLDDDEREIESSEEVRVLTSSMIQARIDGILPDPFEGASI